MSKNKKPMALWKRLMIVAMWIFSVTFIYAPVSEVLMFGYYVRVSGLLVMFSALLFLIGLFFGVITVVSARLGNSSRMAQDDSEVSTAESPNSAVKN